MRSMLAPARLGGHHGARRGAQAPGNHHRLHLRAQHVLRPGQEALHLLEVPLVVGLLAVAQVQPLLGDVDELLLLEIRQVGHRDLVDGLCEEQHLEILLE